MSAHKFTPWTPYSFGMGPDQIRDSRGQVVAYLASRFAGGPKDENPAELLASAPDMHTALHAFRVSTSTALEILQRIEDVNQTVSQELLRAVRVLEDALEQGNEAIAKAEQRPRESVLAQLPKEVLDHLSEVVRVDSSNWIHAICDACWKNREGNRTPVRWMSSDERCCFCGALSEGIYYRADPRELRCRGRHS
jgi:hypothetical protein